MPSYTFADLLYIFFRFRQNSEQIKTQDDLAKAIDVSRRTMAGWFTGQYVPRSSKSVERLARALGVTAFQADLLLYSVNREWVKYGTPRPVLEAAEIVRYKEEDIAPAEEMAEATPSIAQIERDWRLVYNDSFASNYRRWGIGTKHNGICDIQRAMSDGRYVLNVQNQYHEDVFMAGDSSYFAPDVYYFTVQAKMTQGETEDDGYGLVFEEISDECFAILRVREQQHRISVVQMFNGGDQFKIYLRRVPALSIRSKQVNKLAILAMQQEHWFYINDAFVGRASIPRLPYARLDVGIVAGSQQQVICQFQQFRLYVPSAMKLYPNLAHLTGVILEQDRGVNLASLIL
jgi:DNA-binding XRE family transcriptional regulator